DMIAAQMHHNTPSLTAPPKSQQSQLLHSLLLKLFWTLVILSSTANAFSLHHLLASRFSWEEHPRNAAAKSSLSSNPLYGAARSSDAISNDNGNDDDDEMIEWQPKSNVIDFIEQEDRQKFRSFDHADELFKLMCEQLQAKMGGLKISNLQELKDYFEGDRGQRISVTCALYGSGYNYTNIETALEIVFRKAEDKLNGKILSVLYENDNEITRAFDRYVDDAVSVDGPEPGARYRADDGKERCKNIGIVLGPSGSGKTLFALRGLFPPAPSSDDTKSKSVTLYIKARSLLKPQTQEPKTADDILALVKKCLAGFLKVDDYEDVGRLQMSLKFVIDEAVVLGNWVGCLGNLVSLNKKIGTIVENPHLVFVGTGVDHLTEGMASDKQAGKYRMRPWGMDNVQAVLDRHFENTADKNKISGEMHIEPTYQSLVTNARMATFLINALWRRLVLSNKRTNVGDVVNEVATQYIQSNGLGVLRADQRPLVARAVFKALDVSSRNIGTASFPDPPSTFTGEKKLDSRFFCLLDINVESAGGKREFVDNSNPFSVSVSGAICIMLFSLIDTVGSIGARWSSFETMCALNELQRVVMATEAQDLAANLPQLVLPKQPFQAGKARDTFAVPVVGSTHVFLNGDKAPFADIIAPRRLCQLKFSEDATETVTLDLDEFVKMGIVEKICDPDENGQTTKMQGMATKKVEQKATEQATRMQRNGALLSALSQYWVGPSFSSQAKNEAATLAEPSAKAPRQFYPGCLLVGDTIFGPQPEYEMYNCTLENDNLLSNVDDKDGKRLYSYADHLEKEIEAVFYTNARQFEIKRGGSTAVVTPDDVTYDGIITSDINISEVLCIKLRENVSVHFLFARDYKGLT
ncbi:MAG: hypothetical protein SGBAC_011951, partial [Bacillariaceae sp.]